MCLEQSHDGAPLRKNQCTSCAALKKDRAFLAALERAKMPPSATSKIRTLTRAQLEARSSAQAAKIKQLTKTIVRGAESADAAASSSGPLPVSLRRIVDGLMVLNDNPAIEVADCLPVLDVLHGAVKNMNIAKPRGRRHTEHARSMMMYEWILYNYGPRAMRFVAANLNGPMCETTVKAGLNSVPEYRCGFRGSRQVLPIVVALLKEAMEAADVPFGQVPYELSEDETNTNSEVEWDQRTDTLRNFCGRYGECAGRASKCRCPQEHHQCESNFEVPVGSAEVAFANIVAAFQDCKRGNYARVIMINPLHPDLPKIPVFVSATCNMFDNAAVRFQWEVIDALCDECGLGDVLGPRVGHASDGDSRRRKLQLEDMTPKTGCRYKPLTCAAFELSGVGSEVPGRAPVIAGHGQDFVHNGKKMVNPLDLDSKNLLLGEHAVTIGHMLIVTSQFQAHEHQCAERDIQRLDRQNWASAQALFKTPMLKCLAKLHEEKKVPCLGTLVYLRMINRYISVFYSLSLSLADRIKRVSFTLHFLCRWRMWVLKSRKHTLEQNFISRESYLDVLISAHQVILVIRLFRDHCNGVPVCLAELGSDCCESFFSAQGSWVVNKRNYTTNQLLLNTRKIVRSERIRVDKDGPSFGKPTTDRRPNWKGEDPPDAVRANMSDYASVSDFHIGVLWKEGDEWAKRELASLGMVPNTRTHTGDLKWWGEQQCPMVGGKSPCDDGYASGGDDDPSCAETADGSSDDDDDDDDEGDGGGGAGFRMGPRCSEYKNGCRFLCLAKSMTANGIANTLGCTRETLWLRFEQYPDSMFAQCRENHRLCYTRGSEVPVPHGVRMSAADYVNFGRDERGRVLHYVRRDWTAGLYVGLRNTTTVVGGLEITTARYLRLPRDMTVMEIAAMLKCQPGRLVRSLKTRLRQSPAFRDVTSVCSYPKNTDILIPLGFRLDVGVFMSIPTEVENDGEVYVYAADWNAEESRYNESESAPEADIPCIEKQARDAVLPDGTRMHKATLVRYLNEHPHLFGEESRKLDVNRLLRVIQGAKNSTRTGGPAQNDNVVLAVGIGDFVEFLQGAHRRVGLIIEIFNARHESPDEEDANSHRTRYYNPVDMAGPAPATLEFTIHMCTQRRRAFTITKSKLTVKAATCVQLVEMDYADSVYMRKSSRPLQVQ